MAIKPVLNTDDQSQLKIGAGVSLRQWNSMEIFIYGKCMKNDTRKYQYSNNELQRSQTITEYSWLLPMYGATITVDNPSLNSATALKSKLERLASAPLDLINQSCTIVLIARQEV